MQLDIKKMSVTELKSLGYGQFVLLQETQKSLANTQINLQVIQEELTLRAKEELQQKEKEKAKAEKPVENNQ
jgi:hypothetical protein